MLIAGPALRAVVAMLVTVGVAQGLRWTKLTKRTNPPLSEEPRTAAQNTNGDHHADLEILIAGSERE